MKHLTQAVFDGMPKWVKSARIDAKGKLVVYSLEKSLVTRILNNEILLPWNCGIWDSGFVIGLTYNSKLQRYSASAIEIDGVRDNGKLCEWDREGGALDDDLSDLNIDSVQVGVRTI